MKKLIILFFVFHSSFVIRHSSFSQSLSDAVKLTESEQFEKAEDAFKLLIQREPTNGDNFFFRAENYFRQELIDSAFKTMDWDSTRINYERGMQKNPGNPLNYVGIGKVLWFEGKTAEAKKKFYDAIQIISPANKSAVFTPKQKALLYMKIAECYTIAPQKDLPEAINLLNKALKENPQNPEIYVLLGDAVLEQNPGEGGQAIAQYNKALDLDKKYLKAWLRKGQLYARSRNLQSALQQYQEALKINPSYAPAHREIAELYYRAKQYDAAVTNYKKYLDLNSSSCSARIRYSAMLYLSNKYSDAITEINEIKKMCPAHPPFLFRLLGYSYFETGKYPEGVIELEIFFQKQPQQKILASDYSYYGKLLSKSGQDSLAVEKLKLALAKDSALTELWGNIASAYMKMKKYPEAIGAFNKKIKGGKGVDGQDYYDLGRAYFYTSQFGKADTAFLQLITLRPDLAIGYLWRAKANSQMDPDSKQGLAQPFYEEFVSRIPAEETEKNKRNLLEAYSYLGYYYMLQKEYSKAKCNWQKVKELDPSNEKAKKALGEKNVAAANCP